VGASPVSAAGTPTVEFSGGSVLSLLVCKSEPSAPDVSVPADSRVNFVNRLGQNAFLKVDGQSVATVQPNQQVPVVFKKGPVEVAMTFDCGVGVVQQFKPVSVGVTASPAGAAPTGGAANGTPAVNKTGAAAGPAGAAAGAANNAMGGDHASGRSSKSPHGQAGQDGTVAASDPTGDPGLEGDPSLLDPSAAAGSATGVDPSAPVDDRVTVEQPVAASGPARNGPAGLLALVATVCAVGVGIAAIRAIIAQRASRASFA
jgi:hypothetical protein